ncbi:MAG: SPOR domain-containing protein [Candidatus Cloacimonetes bacterium]|nr:SPOR domain-containing protein [Candidatus Cloacimonadota bacterium]
MKKSNFISVIILFIYFGGISAINTKEIINLFNSNKYSELEGIKTEGTIDKSTAACLAYHKNKIKLDKADAESFRLIGQKYEDEYWGQLSFLEAGKICFLVRDYPNALSSLNKINYLGISEHYFWISQIYLKISEFDKAIKFSQDFAKKTSIKAYQELAHFTIAEAYILQNKYNKALNTLRYLQQSALVENNFALLHYKMGYCSEMIDNFESAILFYRKVIMDFPYTKYGNMAENRLYRIRSSNKELISISDIGYIESNKVSAQSVTNTESVKNATATDKYFLQAGVFSTYKNALKQVNNLKKKSYDGEVFTKEVNGKSMYAVAVGSYSSKDEACKAAEILKKDGFDSFVQQRN